MPTRPLTRPKARFKEMKVPKSRAITVYRQWMFYNDRLVGYGTKSWNANGTTRASCQLVHGKPGSPNEFCRCGLYGHIKPIPKEQMLYSGVVGYPVIGIAKIWGRVFKEDGVVRGQYGEVTSLFIKKDAKNLDESLQIFCAKHKIKIEWIST